MNHPFLADDYHIRWSTLTPDHVETDINYAIELAEERLQKIRDLKPDEVTFENTFKALEDATEELQRAWGYLNHLDSVCADDKQREALNKMLPVVSSFISSISLDAELWSAIKACRDSDAVSELNPVEMRFVEETCADFVSSGADLPDDKKARMSEIDSELSAITQKFSENVLDSTNDWELIIDDESRLAGLPEMVKESARLNALEKGYGSEEEPKWRFTQQYPSMGPVMQFADDDSLRKEIWEGGNQIGLKGKWDNTDLIWDILRLRKEKAELLGKKNFPEMVLERRMAKNGETALAFTENLHGKVVDQFRADMEELKDYISEKKGEKIELMQPWEMGYWAEKRRNEMYGFDPELLRPYFSVENVMKGMFDIMSSLFSIRIEERETCYGEDKEGAVQVWHEDCAYYDLFDKDSGEHLGSFYADWHPRSTKRGGAWMNSLRTGLPALNGEPRKPHVGLIVGNMTKPVGDTPALLDHREVETIFHEFGHLLHHLLSEVEIKSLAGTNVAWDFVELPSQILENFCWDRKTLDMFARHYETGETIPDELFDKMVAAKNYMSATGFMRQLAMGKLDLEIHMHLDRYAGLTLDELDKKILEDYKVKLATRGPSLLRRFSHLFSSPVAYASGYYSYKWSEVLDADAFTRFQKEGVLNSDTGMSFRKEILSRGNSRPVDESYRAFMGRDPELEPLLKRSGII